MIQSTGDQDKPKGDGDPRFREISRLDQVPSYITREIEYFFSIYKDLESKKTLVQGWLDREAALRVIDEARGAFSGNMAGVCPEESKDS